MRAYRGEELEIPEGAPQVCPECGKPIEAAKGGKQLMKIVGAAIVLIGVVLAVIVAVPFFSDKPPGGGEKKAEPAGEERLTTGEATAAAPAGTQPPSAGSAEPPAEVTAPANIDLDASRAENRKVKSEVLTRIDLMPSVSQSNKDKLYNSVERARSMGKVLTIPFASGKTALAPADIEALKTNLDSALIMKLRDDPTAVFVVLGYADPKGDEKKNLAISQVRADAVLAAMRDKCGVVNVMHAVAMGSSTLLDAQNLEKNRIVEVWAVLP
ncbi:MAG TPA: OmpA family protein [Chthoniobacteraceae bacterium]